MQGKSDKGDVETLLHMLVGELLYRILGEWRSIHLTCRRALSESTTVPKLAKTWPRTVAARHALSMTPANQKAKAVYLQQNDKHAGPDNPK